jgi:hypothetical protein
LPFKKCVKILDLAIFISLPNFPCVAIPSWTIFFLFLSTSRAIIGFLCLGILVLENMLFLASHNWFNYAKVAFFIINKHLQVIVEVVGPFPFFI